jgi:IS4 transposase
MSATSESIHAVFATLRGSHPKWPHSEGRDTVEGDPWPLAWDAAAFIEEWFTHPGHTDVEEAIYHLQINAEDYGYDTATWHSQHPPGALLKAHIPRIVKGWSGEKALHDCLEDKPALVDDLGLYESLPSQTTLWRVWNKGRLSDTHKHVLTTIAQVLVDVAREHDVPAPDEVLHPAPGFDAPDSVEQDDTSVRDRTITNLKEVWQRAKPMVTTNYTLPRAENTEVHENSFWEGHSFIGSREEMYAEDGTWNFAAETTRDRVQTGSTHRYHIQKIGVDNAREMHQKTTRELIERARRDSELVNGVIASIDITKSNPYRENTELEFDEDGKLSNKWLLGYKENSETDDDESLPDIYFQWASIQVVGLDIPLVLDAIPVHRGLSRAAIVDQLLNSATDLLDIEMLMMDREFAHDGVKEVCENYDVWYLNPGKMHSSERATCTRLRRQGKLVHIESDERSSKTDSTGRTTLTDFTGDEDGDNGEAISEGPSRKRVYMPAMNPDRTSDDGEDDEGDEDTGESEIDRGDEVRQELLAEFADITKSDSDDIEQMFGDVVEEIREEEEERVLPGNEEDTQLYILFETNHPDLQVPDNDEKLTKIEELHMAARVIRQYSHRWGIENGFKKIKSFRVRTTSMKREYRFFNFLYACTLYNVWRLVDLLVRLELRDTLGSKHKPLVTADLFLTIAKNYVGLDPPD